MDKTHWKKLHNPDYIGAYSLMNGDTAHDLDVTIKSIKREMVTGPDGKKEECTVAQLVNNKPFILNATNQKMLAKLFNSPFIEDWFYKPFTLYVARIRVTGESMDALRIRPALPKPPQLPELTPTHEKWNGAVEAIKGGKTTIEAIRAKYTLSTENEQLLCSSK